MLVGEGALALAIRDELSTVDDMALLIAATDGWDPNLLAAAAKAADAEMVSFLPVRVEPGRAVIGPLVSPGAPGCVECADLRRAAADPAASNDAAQLLESHLERLTERSPWLTPIAVRLVAALVANEVRTLAMGGRPRIQGALMIVDLKLATTEVHTFLPDPLCPVCAELPADQAMLGDLQWRSRPKSSAASLRAGDLRAEFEQIQQTYVDSRTGLVSGLIECSAAGLPVTIAATGWRDSGRREHGIGRATDRVGSTLAAILEAVERRAGLAPSGRRVVQHASYAEAADRAVDPRRLGLYAPQDYSADGHRRRPFDPEAEMSWLWGYSFEREGPVLVPASYAGHGQGVHGRAGQGGPPLVFETSNGCALGGCLEEAALHGLLEVAERDSFLLTWYAQIPRSQVDLATARSVDLRLLAERIERLHGYRPMVFDTTVEQGIPSVLALVVDESGDPLRAASLCAAGAHLDPERAAWAAMGELALQVEHQTRLYSEDPARRERAAALAADADLVRAMDDHVLLYCHPETLPRWDFLLSPKSDPVAFTEAFSDRPAPTLDLRDDLFGLVLRYKMSGLDVIVVDQTGPEQQIEGLTAVKVIVPGALPMTFGHRNRRVFGLPRLETVPALLGCPAAGLNPYPHPFP